MILNINKNIDETNKSFMSSKKPYQVVCIVLAFVVSIVIMLVVKPYIGTTLTSYICLGVVFPLGVFGIYEKNGMDFLTYIKKRRSNIKNGNLKYRTCIENEVQTVKKKSFLQLLFSNGKKG